MMFLERQVTFWAVALAVFIAVLWLLSDVLLPFVAGMALAYLGLANKAEAGTNSVPKWCDRTVNACCCRNCTSWLPTTDPNYSQCLGVCFANCGHK